MRNIHNVWYERHIGACLTISEGNDNLW